ncbi:Gfo/Idh/MocA family oxidoreductase [Tsukamurella soli]|uniref:Gfo/Idh/MocA family oxidoreductase n=1 Tax=Tsukamurella soli TaxID=644556 RepID=A0ABP8J284_9ACTN
MGIRIGLVGYGVGGRWFHAPYIEASDACDLVGVVTRSPARIESIRDELPGVPVFGSLSELIDAGVDAVVISTPPQTRRELVLEAIGRGVAVVADKPFAPTADAGAELAAAAQQAGVLLNVFHNRRWDTDVVTARGVLASGALGDVQRLDLRFDLDEPQTLEAGPDGGLLRDLGSHVVDQALDLLGPARAVTAQLDWVDLPAGRTDASFTITLDHVSGAHSHVSATKLARIASRELRLIGTAGSYVSDFRDVQTASIFAGGRPAGRRETWGFEDEVRWGTLATAAGRVAVPSAQGDYSRFYDEFAEAVVSGGPGPVPAVGGIATLRVLDAVRRSAAEGRTVEVGAAQV